MTIQCLPDSRKLLLTSVCGTEREEGRAWVFHFPNGRLDRHRGECTHEIADWLDKQLDGEPSHRVWAILTRRNGKYIDGCRAIGADPVERMRHFQHLVLQQTLGRWAHDRTLPAVNWFQLVQIDRVERPHGDVARCWFRTADLIHGDLGVNDARCSDHAAIMIDFLLRSWDAMSQSREAPWFIIERLEHTIVDVHPSFGQSLRERIKYLGDFAHSKANEVRLGYCAKRFEGQLKLGGEPVPGIFPPNQHVDGPRLFIGIDHALDTAGDAKPRDPIGGDYNARRTVAERKPTSELGAAFEAQKAAALAALKGQA